MCDRLTDWPLPASSRVAFATKNIISTDGRLHTGRLDIPSGVLNLEVSNGEGPGLLIFVTWQVPPDLRIVLKFFISNKILCREDGRVFCLGRENWVREFINFLLLQSSDLVSKCRRKLFWVLVSGNLLKAKFEKFLPYTTWHCICAPWN